MAQPNPMQGNVNDLYRKMLQRVITLFSSINRKLLRFIPDLTNLFQILLYKISKRK